MRKKRQISHTEEFQGIYVDTLPPRRGSKTPHSVSEGCAEWPPSKLYNIERERKGVTLQGINQTNATSGRWLRPPSAVINNVGSTYAFCGVMKIALHLCDLAPTNPNPSLIMRKTPGKSQYWGTVQNTWPDLIETLKGTKRGKVWEAATATRSLKRPDN